MSLCTCPERPPCQYHHCGNAADWSLITPPGRWLKTWPHGRLHFMCTPCRDYYVEVLPKLLKGIDRPEGADDDWRPSIMEHLRHAQIAMAFERRNERPAPPVQDDLRRDGDEKRFTPAQQKQIMAWRKGLREMRRTNA
jgi:hypothetical protein